MTSPSQPTSPSVDGAINTAAKYLDDLESEMLSSNAPKPSEIAEMLRAALSAPRSPSVDALRPYTYGYQFHDCVRFEDREVNGCRPISSFPLYDQKTVDGLTAEIERLRALSSPRVEPTSPSVDARDQHRRKIFG